MYEAITYGIKVAVLPEYDARQSAPEEGYYFWAYTVTITNRSERAVQLKSREWRITDASGHTQQVNGAGVVGKTPKLAIGESFTYTSGCPLRTPQGLMAGSYQMQAEDGEMFNVEIPAFSLDCPKSAMRPN